MALTLRPLAAPFNGRRVLTAPVSPASWSATVHTVLDFVLGLPIFVFFVVLVSVTLGLACTVVLAIPTLAMLLVGARLLGMFERARFRALLDVDIADPYTSTPGPIDGTAWHRLRGRVLSMNPYKEILYGLLLFPLACIGFALVTLAWAGSAALVLLPLYIGALPRGAAQLWWFDVQPGAGALLASALGVVGLFLAPWVAQGWARLDAAIGRLLLGRSETEQLEERVEELETTRSFALEIAEAERRRIERDLHDGAQQRLVALAMDLGLAREKLPDDPEAARQLIDHAHDEAKRAIAELRDLARGIHPVALSDRGLAGAIPALAGRCPLPVDVHVSVPDRLSPSIEGITYFIVSECLANAAKHAGATRASVRVSQRGPKLHIEITDDGVGGADGALGTGLRGLADRAASVDGTFQVSSPIGGPTVIQVELPCAS